MADNFDKFLPDWQIGTLTLSANSTAFTATDALLTFGSIQQGDFIISPDGRMLVIESITDDDNGVLSTPCPPEAAGTFQTRIRYQSDNSRYTGQTAALRRLLSGGNLFALSKLAGDPETVVRFLANGSFDLVDPATFGIQDPNGTLAKFAALTVTARQIFQTDENGALKAIALAANKLLNTDANGDILLSGITPFARTVLDDASGSAMFATMGARIFGSGDNGGVVFPNGIIIQWGFIGVVSGAGTLITYPEAFPSSCFVFNAQIFTDYRSDTFAPLVYADWDFSSGGLSQRSIWTRQINQNGSSVTVTGLNDMNIRWFAIGM